MPAVSSNSTRRSVGLLVSTASICPCEIIAYDPTPNPVPDNRSAMSRNRTGERLMKYSLSPVRYVRRVISTSENEIGNRPSELSNKTETSASPSGLRASFPAKITSSSFPPRRLLLDVSPSDQRNASTKFDLPEPFGPTIAVIPSANVSVVGSANVLKPNALICLSFNCFSQCP